MNYGVTNKRGPGDWETPQDLFDKLHTEFGFTLDPCATRQTAKCAKYYTESDDGLAQDWSTDRVFLNPPYGRAIGKWVKKAWEESQRGAVVVCLLPASTDTKWFHEYCRRGEIRFLRGRVKFRRGGRGGGAPFASMLVIFRPPGSEQAAQRRLF